MDSSCARDSKELLELISSHRPTDSKAFSGGIVRVFRRIRNRTSVTEANLFTGNDMIDTSKIVNYELSITFCSWQYVSVQLTFTAEL